MELSDDPLFISRPPDQPSNYRRVQTMDPHYISLRDQHHIPNPNLNPDLKPNVNPNLNPNLNQNREEDITPLLPSSTSQFLSFETSVPEHISTTSDLTDATCSPSSHGFGGASRSSAIFNLSTTIVGAGIMALPATLKVLGLPIGLLVIGFMGWLSQVSIDMLIRSSSSKPSSQPSADPSSEPSSHPFSNHSSLSSSKPSFDPSSDPFSNPSSNPSSDPSSKPQVWSYGDLVEGSHGPRAKLLLQFAILLNNVGICVAYLIIIADVLSGTVAGNGNGNGDRHTGVLEEWAGEENNFWTSRFWVLFCSSVFILGPLIAQKRVESLQFTSALSIALALVFLLITAVVFLIKLGKGQIVWPRMMPDVTSPEAVLRLCSIIPVMSNAFICHFNVHPIWVELEDRSESKMREVGKISLSLCTFVYLASSFSAYLLFGEKTDSDVLSNFDEDLKIPGSDILNGTVRIGYAFHVMLVFPLIFFALRQNVDNVLFPKARTLVIDNFRFWLLTIILMGIIFLGALLVPNIWIAFQFTGATSAVAIGFIFPAIIALSDKFAVFSSTERIIARFMLILAVVVSVTGVFSAVVGLFVDFKKLP